MVNSQGFLEFWGGIYLINDWWKVATLFISAVIGAGFASGKEILNFFSKYQKMSIYGLGLSGVLFFVFAYSLFNLIYTHKDRVNSFSDLFPHSVRIFYNIISYGLVFCIFSVMIAGLSSYGNATLGVNGIFFGLVCTFVFAYVFIHGKGALINSSLIISPIMCAGIVFMGVYYLLLSDKTVFNPFMKISYSWIISSVAYVSYNSIPLIALFWEVRELFSSKNVCFKGAFFGCLSLTAISMILDFLLKEFFVKVKVMDIPMLYISGKLGAGAEFISETVILLAMVSTALSSGFSLISTLERKTQTKRYICTLLICVSGFIASLWGFSYLVEYIYPLFGYAGFVIIIYVIWKNISNNRIKFDKIIK